MGVVLSIVVPIFNVEKYLRKCVDSLLSQGLREDEYEIVLVDDGSTDSSGIIADGYAASCHNIKVIHQPNKGLGAARNTGIHNASGQYIQFVDSDDFIETDVLRSLLNQMVEDDLDVLRFNYRNVNEQYEAYEPNKESRPYMDYGRTVSSGPDFLENSLGYACYACQFIVRASLLRDRGLEFVENRYFEDTEWTPRMLVHASRVSATDRTVYCYLSRPGSITQSPEKRDRILSDQILLIDSLLEQCQAHPSLRWYGGMVSNIVIPILQNVSRMPLGEMSKYVRMLRGKGVFPLSSYHLTETAGKKIRLINVSPLLFCIFYSIRNSR